MAAQANNLTPLSDPGTSNTPVIGLLEKRSILGILNMFLRSVGKFQHWLQLENVSNVEVKKRFDDSR